MEAVARDKDCSRIQHKERQCKCLVNHIYFYKTSYIFFIETDDKFRQDQFHKAKVSCLFSERL